MVATLFGVILNVSYGFSNGTDLLGLIVGDGNVEFLFEFHDQCDGVKRDSAMIFCEGTL